MTEKGTGLPIPPVSGLWAKVNLAHPSDLSDAPGYVVTMLGESATYYLDHPTEQTAYVCLAPHLGSVEAAAAFKTLENLGAVSESDRTEVMEVLAQTVAK